MVQNTYKIKDGTDHIDPGHGEKNPLLYENILWYADFHNKSFWIHM